MYKIYESCPAFISDSFTLRSVKPEDCRDLLAVYSDPKAQKLFNSDNCHGDDFCYQCEEQMQLAIDFWLMSYRRGYFVRLSIIDNESRQAVGTVEFCLRDSTDKFDNMTVFRLDLRSDHETETCLRELLSLLLPEFKAIFGSDFLCTKIPMIGQTRRRVFTQMGFVPTEDRLIGHDGTEYGDYCILAL